jgi:hypothetical protein
VTNRTHSGQVQRIVCTLQRSQSPKTPSRAPGRRAQRNVLRGATVPVSRTVPRCCGIRFCASSRTQRTGAEASYSGARGPAHRVPEATPAREAAAQKAVAKRTIVTKGAQTEPGTTCCFGGGSNLPHRVPEATPAREAAAQKAVAKRTTVTKGAQSRRARPCQYGSGSDLSHRVPEATPAREAAAQKAVAKRTTVTNGAQPSQSPSIGSRRNEAGDQVPHSRCNGSGSARPFGCIGPGLRHGNRGATVQLSKMFIRTNGRSGRTRASGGLPHGGAVPSGSAPDGRVNRARQHVSAVGASATSVPGEQQHSIGEATSGGHLALKGVRLLEREKL